MVSQHKEDYITKYDGELKDDVADTNQLVSYLAKAYPRLNYTIILIQMCPCKPLKNADKPHLKIFDCSMMPDKLHDIQRLNVLTPLRQGRPPPSTATWAQTIIQNYISPIPNGRRLLCGARTQESPRPKKTQDPRKNQ